MLANDSRHLAARPPPLETTPYAIMFIGDASHHRERGEFRAYVFKEPKLLVQTMDGRGTKTFAA